MKRNLITAVLITVVTTIMLGLVYPLFITGLGKINPETRQTANS